MRKLALFSVVLSGVLTLSFSELSFAQGCQVTGATPDGGQVVVCTGTDSDGLSTTNQADDVTIEIGADITGDPGDPDGIISTLDGDDKVLMKGGTITVIDVSDDCISLGPGNTEFHMLDGSMTCERGVESINPGRAKITIDGGTITANNEGECLVTMQGDDEIYVNGGILTATDGVIQVSFGDDIIIVTGGVLTQVDDSDEAISGSFGDDLISISNAIVDASMAFPNEAVAGQGDDDIVRLGTGAQIFGLISGGNDFDTLVFEMEVTESLIPSLCSQILAQDPGEGEITINGLFYDWAEFEVILCELTPSEPRPIPTLSEWGLIAMAGLIGITGVLFVVRKQKQMFRS